MHRGFLIAAALASIAAARPGLEIRRAYEALEQAIVVRNADAALTRVSAASLDEWARLRQLALRGSRDEVEALAPGPRLAVLGIRHVAPIWLLRDGTPRDLASHAVRAGLADRRAVDRLDLADVAVLDRHRALGQLYAAGFPSGLRVGFVREQERWRLDLEATLVGVGRIVSQAARSTGLPESRVILNLLEAVTGEAATDSVWRPFAPEFPERAADRAGENREPLGELPTGVGD
jgi:hypothetical protein